MKRSTYLLIAAIALICISTYLANKPKSDDSEAAPIFGIKVPPGFRDWRVISVAHEAGNNNDLRVVLGNDIAIRAYRRGIRPFPDGTIIARLAWSYVPSAENNKVFGREQSWIAGDPTNIQFDVKDSRRFAATDGWGYAQFKDGKPADAAVHETCYPCHALAKERDLVFTDYAQTP